MVAPTSAGLVNRCRSVSSTAAVSAAMRTRSPGCRMNQSSPAAALGAQFVGVEPGEEAEVADA